MIEASFELEDRLFGLLNCVHPGEWLLVIGTFDNDMILADAINAIDRVMVRSVTRRTNSGNTIIRLETDEQQDAITLIDDMASVLSSVYGREASISLLHKHRKP